MPAIHKTGLVESDPEFVDIYGLDGDVCVYQFQTQNCSSCPLCYSAASQAREGSAAMRQGKLRDPSRGLLGMRLPFD